MERQKLITEMRDRVNQVEDEISDGYSINDDADELLQQTLYRNNKEVKTALKSLTDEENKRYRDLSDVVAIEDNAEKLLRISREIRERLELENFFKQGNIFDIEKLKKKWKSKNLGNKFPNFKWDEFEDLIKNPPYKIKNPLGENVSYDAFEVKKTLIAIVQMIFDEMDIYEAAIGIEGTGKSCFNSQRLLFYYHVLSKLGLIDYAYDIKAMFFTSLISLMQAQNSRKMNDFFRIYVLDEGNDLSKQNYMQEENQDFKFVMRSSRKSLRIMMFSIQQLGELTSSLALSRLNFIFSCNMKNSVKTGTLDKGWVDMYIIPRGEFIYSPKQRRNITRIEILNKLANNLDRKKNYYVSLPTEIIVHSFRFDDVWGFDKKKYDRHIYNENRHRLSRSRIKTNDSIAYVLYNKLPEVKNWGTFDLQKPSDKKMYNLFKKWYAQIKNTFLNNPEKLERFKELYQEK